MTVTRFPTRPLAFLLPCLVFAAACGDAFDPRLEGGNALIRVDVQLLPWTRADGRITCGEDSSARPEGASGPDIQIELEQVEGEEGQPVWEGVFALPEGECTLTLALWCDEEVVCIASEVLQVENADNVYDDLTFVCSGWLGPC